MRTFLCATFCALLTSVAVPGRADGLSAKQIAAIGTIANAALVNQHVSGMEVGVGRRGTLLYAQGYGLRERADHRPVTPRTIFPIGSITKQFTAAAVMMLVQRGKVRLDAVVSRYLPSAPHARDVTVRELLDQTSGLPDYLENPALYRSIVDGTVQQRTIAQYVNLVAGQPLHFKPGSKWEYSNTNYALLGMLIERVSEEAYATFLDDAIFTPLGLASTSYLTTFVAPGPDSAHGYTYAKGAFAPVGNYDLSWGNAAGALGSTVSDLVRWDGAFLAGRVIPPKFVEIATTPPAGVPVIVSKRPQDNVALGYAFGWVDGRDEGRKILWHNGGLIGARAMNLVFPSDGLEIVVLTNDTGADPDALALRIARMLYSSS
ncbi:MAG TPA: serine hydrolase domain-containing protein [Candidatus Acidoferrales bacterium]|nr:serine hydrolase domain-containing protein [Candidatus Acidoferrales bacterium]